MPGWTATVRELERAPWPTTRADPPACSSRSPLPAGTTVVRFTFLPPHEYPAGLLALVGLLVLVASLLRWAAGTPPAGRTGTGAGTGSRRVARRYPPESTRGQGGRVDSAPMG